MRTILLVSAILLLFSGCNLREREQELDDRTTALAQKEHELELKEKSLKLREQALLQKEKITDSTIQKDSTAIYEPALLGAWAVKMICTDATCPGSAVGDIKNETWQMSYQDKNILVRAMTGDQLVRVYSGIYNGSVIELAEDRETEEAVPHSRMTVRLTIQDSVSLKGQREILKEGNCKIVYSVNMTKQ